MYSFFVCLRGNNASSVLLLHVVLRKKECYFQQVQKKHWLSLSFFERKNLTSKSLHLGWYSKRKRRAFGFKRLPFHYAGVSDRKYFLKFWNEIDRMREAHTERRCLSLPGGGRSQPKTTGNVYRWRERRNLGGIYQRKAAHLWQRRG